MDVLTDGLLAAATLFAGGYCWVLARRVRDLKSLDSGLGGAIVTLTRQIELARDTLDEAKAQARAAQDDLGDLIARADSARGQLKLQLAAAKIAGAAPADVPADRPEPARAAPATAVLAPPAEATPPPSAEPQRMADIAALFAGEAAAEPAPDPSSLPKPRALPPIANPLRRREPPAPVRSEDELMALLTSMAAGGAA